MPHAPVRARKAEALTWSPAVTSGQRATFIIDADGRVAHVIPKVSPKTHDEEALAALANLRDAA